MTKKQLKFYGAFVGKWFALPAALYLVLFYAFNPMHLGHFSDRFYLDSGDGFQNVWNFWWVNFSITHLGQSPYFTDYLQFPHGVSLIPQTMNIFNGLVGIPLMAAGLSLVQTVNTMVVFSFVMGGVTMFWLVRHLSKSYAASLLAGAMFTFSSYHFAHAIGHMQLISLEWVPLFLLLWILLLERQTYKYAIGAGAALSLTLLCDHYYFLYSVIAAVIIGGYLLATKKLRVTKQLILLLAVFVACALVAAGPLLGSLLWLNHTDKLLGFHDSLVFSLDGLSAVLPGGNWYWYSLFAWFNDDFEAYHAETSNYFGLALLALLAVAFFARKKLKIPNIAWAWWIILGLFAVLSLGPRLQLFHKTLDSVPLPYAWLEAIFPTLKLSGMPIRMIFMAQLAAVVIAAFVVSRITLNKRLGVALFAAIAAVAFIDVYPRPLPLTTTEFPAYAHKLQQLPLAKGSGIIDNAALTGTDALYAQVLHQKPETFGYLTRTPQSAANKSFHIFAALEQDRHQELCTKYKIRYLATRTAYNNGYPVVYTDRQTGVRIYDLRNDHDC